MCRSGHSGRSVRQALEGGSGFPRLPGPRLPLGQALQEKPGFVHANLLQYLDGPKGSQLPGRRERTSEWCQQLLSLLGAIPFSARVGQ